MIDFAQLQETAKKNLERDRSIRSIKASGPTLEYAVSDAATTLDIPVYRVEYEVLERGFPGFMGMGKKDWQIQAYERISKIKKKIDVEEEVLEEVEAVPQIKNKDGRAFVFMQAGGKVMLKVTPPEGHGARAARHDIEPIFHRKGAGNIDWKKVEKALHVASGEYVQVGEFDHHSYNDSVVTVRIADGDMQAFMTVSAPGEGGCDIPYDDYVLTLKMNKVVHGIKEDFLLEFADWPIYREEVEVAVGSKPVDGKPAWMQYEFETDQNKVRLKEGTSGKINFKELNIIHNVVENQLLATKIPPQSGTPGETVTGRTLPAGDGRDISMPVGENVVEGPDGATLYSKISGRVVFTNGKVNVEPVLVVEGNVSLQTGNILFLGTVVIRGDVEDGFSVKAAGDVEVHGSIARAEIDAEGNIMVHQGINGKGEGSIRTGKTLWARFIENANIQAGDMVFASDSIVNSNIDAQNRIICQGKRAIIVGGRLRAAEEVNAKTLGNSTSGTETICEVGYDPAAKEELLGFETARSDAVRELEEIKVNMQTLINLKQQKRELPEDKLVQLQELIDRRDFLIKEGQGLDEKIREGKERLANLKIRGKVSASAKVFPGVKIVIRDVKDEVQTEYKAVTFVLEGGLIRVTKYEEPDSEHTKAPDGYTTN